MEHSKKTLRRVVFKDEEDANNSPVSSPMLVSPAVPSKDDVDSNNTTVSSISFFSSPTAGPSTSTPKRDDVPTCRKRLRFSESSWSSVDTFPPDQTIIASMLTRAIGLNKKIRLIEEEVLSLNTRKTILVKELETVKEYLDKECNDEFNITWKK